MKWDCWVVIASVCVLLLGGGRAEQAVEGELDRFYIHDWPSLDGYSTWPLPHYTLQRGKIYTLDYHHEHSWNFGAGAEVNASLGLYSTNPYHLYQLIMARLRVHPLRVMEKSKANLFFVPYDIAIASQWNTKTGVYKLHQAGGCEAADEVKTLLSAAVAGSSLQGHDHVIIDSLFGILNFNCYDAQLRCPNCIRLSSEPSRSKYPLQYDLQSGYYKYALKRNISIPQGTFGVPIPACVHYNENLNYSPWLDWEKDRPIYVAAWFAIRVQNNIAKNTRYVVSKQCKRRLDKCSFVEILERGGHQSKTVSLTKKKKIKIVSSKGYADITANFTTGYDYYLNSVFCLQPPGDMEMRKGLFDSLLLGCIPVLFLPNILTRKYPWYFTPEIEESISVNIDMKSVPNVITHLEAISPEVIQQKRRAIAKVAASISYSIPPKSMLDYIGVGRKGVQDGMATWQPPFPDAVDKLLTALFKNVRSYKQTGMVPREERLVAKTGFELYWKRDDV